MVIINEAKTGTEERRHEDVVGFSLAGGGSKAGRSQRFTQWPLFHPGNKSKEKVKKEGHSPPPLGVGVLRKGKT